MRERSALAACRHNPHYYEFQGKPIVLVTSAEHYGSVVNRDFDFARYLDALRAYELNYTRIYTGIYTERKDMFIQGNTLGVDAANALLPWARSDTDGCADGGKKYDLSRWDDEYFQRLRTFLHEAARRQIFVEVCLFNCQYPESWNTCPLNARNNVQGTGTCDVRDVQTLHDAPLLEEEIRYARKITAEAGCFDNVVLEVCDEPTLKGTTAADAVKWISRMVDEIRDEQRSRGMRHLVAQQLETEVDFTDDERLPVIVTQYIRHNETRQVGGVEALEREYHHGKPIELNETAYYPLWYPGDAVASSRVEAWEFMVGGGAAYNHLNSLFTVEDPAGNTADNRRILLSLRCLRRFIESFQFSRMYRDSRSVVGGLPDGATANAISEPGRQYAVYLHHGVLPPSKLAYLVTPGYHRARLEMDLPRGTYSYEWVSPEDGMPLMAGSVAHGGGPLAIEGPRYSIDIALRVLAEPRADGLGRLRMPQRPREVGGRSRKCDWRAPAPAERQERRTA